MAYRVLSVNDLEIFYEGRTTAPFITLGDLYEIRKELTTTSGPGEAYWNAIYGAHAFYQMSTEMNIFGVLPKVTWPRSGWRYLTNWAYTNLTGGYNTYGIGETGTLDNIEAEPEINAVKTAPKIIANSFSVSEVLESLARVDDNWGNIKQLREFGALEHQKTLNMMLGERMNLTAGYYDPRILSLDIIITNADELNAAGATSTTYTNANIYGVDRFSWDGTNSKVLNNKDWAIPYAENANGAISNQLILNAIVNARKRGGNTNVVMTGYDTYADIQNLYMTYVRYVGGWGETEVQFGVEGIKTAKGVDAGIKVASLYGIPLIPSVNFEADATYGKENMYFLDTSAEANEPRLSFSVARPTEYFETADPFINNAFRVRGLYRTIGEVIAKNLYGQAKIYGIQ